MARDPEAGARRDTARANRWAATCVSVVVMAMGSFSGCGRTKVELLGLRHDAGGPLDPSLPKPDPDAGPPVPALPTDAGADAAAPDSGQDAATPDAGPGDCAAGALICEDFETNLAGWTFVRSDGTATATTQDSRSGGGALELATRSAGAFAYLERRVPSVSTGSLHLRAFLKVPADQVVDVYDLLVLSNAAGDVGAAVAFNGATLSLASVARGTAAPGALGLARDAWVCLEVTLVLSPAWSAVSDVDGARDATLLTDENVPSGGYSRVALGVVRASPGQMPTRILVDDLVLATTPIGCE